MKTDGEQQSENILLFFSCRNDVFLEKYVLRFESSNATGLIENNFLK
jgi:hypothetical protein